jgi:hypothetical protein
MTVALLESVTRTALLGMRFWDALTARVVCEGITVTETSSGTAGTAGPSGVFAFHDLPGLYASAFGDGSPGFWASPPEHAVFSFEVTDATNTFLPFGFSAAAPTRELLAQAPSSPPGMSDMPLFSSTARQLPAASAVVRAELWDALAARPAPSALLEVTVSGATHYGLSDAAGRVVVAFPYPEPPTQISSPPGSQGSWTTATWPLTLGVRYAAAPAGAASSAVPMLDAVLAQPQAVLLAASSPETPLGGATLPYGSELVLRSAGQSTLSVLTT